MREKTNEIKNETRETKMKVTFSEFLECDASDIMIKFQRLILSCTKQTKVTKVKCFFPTRVSQ